EISNELERLNELTKKFIEVLTAHIQAPSRPRSTYKNYQPAPPIMYIKMSTEPTIKPLQELLLLLVIIYRTRR
ncbi:9036_t:CDS:1, partial [Racocetra persica]